MKIKQKLIATTLSLVILSSYLLPVGNHVIAATTDLGKQDTKTGSSNVEFNSYLENKTHEQTFEEQGKLYVELSVKENGYLKNAAIELIGANYSVDGNQIKNDNIEKIEQNKIKLKQINTGVVKIELPIKMLEATKLAKDNFNKISEIKFTATYVDQNGKEKQVEKTIQNQIKWHREAKAQVIQEIVKYIPYHQGEEYGVLVQTKINSKIEENKMPVQKSEIKVQAPELNMLKDDTTQENAANKNYPAEVKVIANHTKATNGQTTSAQFSSQNYTYNKETGEVIITVENNQETIAWEKEADDEYLVNYIYQGEDLYNYVKENEITLKNSVQANLTTYNAEPTVLEAETEETYTLKENKGNLLDFEIEATKELSKGYLYANYDKKQNEEKIETPYSVKYLSKISYANIINNIEIQTLEEKLIDEQENKYSSNNAIYSKKVTIPVAIFSKILGEEGKIEIQNKDGKVLGTITKETTVEEQNYALNIEEYQENQIKITTSKPVQEGQLTITVEKAFAKEQNYKKNQMEIVKKVELQANMASNTNKQVLTNQISLKEPVAKAKVMVNKAELSTVAENKNIEITAILDTSSVENALYKNPVLEFYMPEAVENISVKEVTVTPKDELKVEKVEIAQKQNQKVIQVYLKGTQTNYTLDSMINGTSIVVNTDITIKEFTPTTNTQIKMLYKNENSNLYENTQKVATPKKARALSIPSGEDTGVATTDLTLVTPTGLITGSGINGYRANAENVLNTTETMQTVGIKAGDTSKTAQITGKIINNYANSISNVKILGRTPFKGNKKIDTTQELGSTFTATMRGPISLSGVSTENYKVYYSTQEEATNDITNAANNWQESVTDYSNIKSWLIEFTNSYEITTGTAIDFSYSIELPERLSHDELAYYMYKVYYQNNQEAGAVAQNKDSSMIELTTGSGAKLEINLTSNVPENTPVNKGEKITYTITVKNVGSQDANNVIIMADIPNNTVYLATINGKEEESPMLKYTQEIEKIKVGETKQFTYSVKADTIYVEDFCAEPTHYSGGVHKVDNVHPISDWKTIVETNAEVCLLDNNEFYKSKEVKNTIAMKPIEVELINAQEGKVQYNPLKRTEDAIKVGEEFTYLATVTNLYANNFQNVVAQITIPEGLTYKEASLVEGENKAQGKVNYNTFNKTVTVTMNQLQATQQQQIKVKVTANDLANNQTQKSTTVNMQVSLPGNDEIYASNNVKLDIVKTELLISQTSNIKEKYLYEGDEIVYQLQVKNISNKPIAGAIIEDEIPQGLTFEKMGYYLDNGKESFANNIKDGKASITSDISEKQTLYVNVYCKANDLKGNNELKIVNTPKITAEGYGTASSNSVEHIIKPIGNNPGGEDEPSLPNTYKISGEVWLDSNQDGLKAVEEPRVKDVEVVIIDSKTLQIVKDGKTNQNKTTKTDENGFYSFKNIPDGEYIAIFIYNTQRYGIAPVNEKQGNETNNQDGVPSTITLNGKDTMVAIAQNLKIAGGNLYNIDLGLIENDVFDLKLDKYITKLSLTTPSAGTKTVNKKSQLEKVEVASRNAGKASLVIEYKIIITNEGNTPGYAKKVVDYLPEGWKFNTEINSDWYLGKDTNNIFNNSLENIKINPGESKELTVVISKTVNKEDYGKVVSNKAEIYESYSEQGLSDIDSKVANQVETEDDFSIANLIISVTTGKTILYTSLTLGVLAILTTGVIMIKKVFKDKKY